MCGKYDCYNVEDSERVFTRSKRPSHRAGAYRLAERHQNTLHAVPSSDAPENYQPTPRVNEIQTRTKYRQTMGLKTEKSGIKKEHQVACLRRITIKEN